MKKIAASFSIFLFLIICSESYAQISPGDLTTAHADLEGISNCTKCHELGEQVKNSKCLDCHTEIQQTINQNRGYHSSGDVNGKDCWDCHSEHHGRNFRIINFNPDNFNHSKTSFELTGKHKDAKCRDCHKPQFIKDTGIKKRDDTYLGLSMECSSCHEDFHRGNLSNKCSSCHNTEAFRPAPKFDHDKAAFKLTGAHLQVECIDCHPKQVIDGKDFQKFTGINFANCASCHRDIHNGKFGQDCKSCHQTSSFKNINRQAFDHSKTDFNLVGKHKLVTCNECHKTSVTQPIKHEKCIDCHQDYHKGQFTKEGILADCNQCHNEFGFSPSIFTIENHNKTEFKLTGSHLAVPCRNCHYKNENWSFRDLGNKCIDCHENVHENEITKEFMPGNDCTKCHETASWKTITFDHSKTNFELLGKHKKETCDNCHYKKVENIKVFKFASLNSNCENCHKDVHYNQFKSGDDSNCRRCHGFEDWRPVNFDHNNTDFPLTGAHENVKCSECHKQVIQNDNKFIQYKIEDFKCAACHSS